MSCERHGGEIQQSLTHLICPLAGPPIHRPRPIASSPYSVTRNLLDQVEALRFYAQIKERPKEAASVNGLSTGPSRLSRFPQGDMYDHCKAQRDFSNKPLSYFSRTHYSLAQTWFAGLQFHGLDSANRVTRENDTATSRQGGPPFQYSTIPTRLPDGGQVAERRGAKF